VHSLDFYTGLQLTHEDNMAQPLPFITLPAAKSRFGVQFAEVCRERLRGMAEARHECDEFETKTLVRSSEQAREDFVTRNTVALKDGTFQVRGHDSLSLHFT
jgi:hypothetical protein